MGESIYSISWFKRNKEKWQKHFQEFENKDIKYLEVGCFEGESIRWMFENYNISEAHVFDTFEGSMEHKEVGNMTEILVNMEKTFRANLSDWIDKIVIHKGLSQIELRKLPVDNQFDMIYLDGSHQSEDTLEDAVLSFRLLKNNGLMIFDDYTWEKYEDKRLNPKFAIDCFLKVYKNSYMLVDKDKQLIIRKI